MNKIKIVLYTLDTVYAEYFSNFMRNPVNNMKFETKIFTDEETFKHEIRNQKHHILLTDCYLEDEETNNFDRVIRLSEDQSNGSDSDISVFKYRPLNELLSAVLSLHFEAGGKMQTGLYGENKGTVISFYSGNGGAGKTVLSLCLAKHLTVQGKRVFYLNLESLHTMNLFFKEDKQSSAEVFYYLKNNTDKLMAKIESLKSHDALTHIDYFTFPMLPEEMHMLTADDVALLVQSLKNLQEYDYIIIDMDTSLHERNKASLNISDDIFWVLSSDEPSMAKSKYLLDENLLDLNFDKSKIHYIINKAGSQLFEGYNHYNYSIETTISNYTSWLELPEKEKIMRDTSSGEELAKLVERNANLYKEESFVEN